MGVYVYCLAGDDDPVPDSVTGVEEAPVAARSVAGLVAWVSTLDRAPSPSLESARAHNRVVELAALGSTPVPFRFGQWFESDDALRSSLEDRGDRLRAALERVRGALEFGVRVVDPAHVPDPPDRTSGRAYLESLARQDQREEADRRRGLQVAEALGRWVAPRIREQRVRLLGGTGGLVAVAHLVDRHDTGNYQRRVREFPARRPALRFLFNGPWPPYGFVADEE